MHQDPLLVRIVIKISHCFFGSKTKWQLWLEVAEGYHWFHHLNDLAPLSSQPTRRIILWLYFMMTSSNGNIYRVTGLLCGQFTGHRWIPLTKASDTELWCFLWSAPWINGWHNREAGDLGRHRAHHDVIVMCVMCFQTRHLFLVVIIYPCHNGA